MCCFPSTPTLSPALPPLVPASFFCFCFIAVRTLWLNLSARCLSSFTGRFNRPTPSDSTPSSRLWYIPTQCAALTFLSGLSPLRSPLLHNLGVYAGALGFNPMLLPKLDQREIPRSRDRGNSYRSNPGSPSIRGSGSCLRLCRVIFVCYTPTGGSRPTPAGAGQGGECPYMVINGVGFLLFQPRLIRQTCTERRRLAPELVALELFFCDSSVPRPLLALVLAARGIN